MMLLGGLPGTGKSTIADSVGGEINATIIDSDRVRKRLVDSDTEGEVPDYGEGIYTEEWTRRTYRRCLELTRRKLEQGQRVIIEASFKDNERRRIFWELADQLSIDAFFVEYIADDNEIRNRLKARNGGPSDADWDIYRKMKDSWDGLEYWPEKYRFRLDTNQPLASTCSELKQFLPKNSLLSREESL
jgi:predicted kinase